jgi:hypothetical protein
MIIIVTREGLEDLTDVKFRMLQLFWNDGIFVCKLLIASKIIAASKVITT